MTDGILLAELQRDRDLRRYDTIIVDEAHERSLNIDFILGYLTQLLPRRPDLKVIVTSATIDTERFAKHFDAPVIEVSGRTYPVEMRYRPLATRRTSPPATRHDRPGRRHPGRGRRAAPRGPGRRARVPQRRARDPRRGRRPRGGPPRRHRGPPPLRPPVGRRAAAGVPAPPGPARRAGHQRGRDVDHRARRALRGRRGHGPHLAVQPPDQGPAPADRAGEPGLRRPAGRALRPGGARASASASTPRTTTRPGPSSPSPRSCAPTWRRSSCRWRRCAWATSSRSRSSTRPTPARSATPSPCSSSWGPCAADRTLTKLGPAARPHPGRPPVRADDPRGRPPGLRARGAGRWPPPCRSRTCASAPPARRRRPPPSHRRFADPDSRLHGRAQPVGAPGGRAQGPGVEPVPQDVPGRVPQPRAGARVAGPGPPAAPGRQATWASAATTSRRRPTPSTGRCWPGCCRTSALYDREARDYLGARQARFAIARGSGLHRQSPPWVMAGELVETNRMWARMVARIQPQWVEAAAGHLVKRSYGEPRWEADRGSAVGRRAGHPLRPADRGAPAGAARPGRPRPGPRPVHRPRPRAGRVAHRPPVRGAQRRPGRRGAGAGGPGAAPRPAGRGAGAVRPVRRPGRRRRDLGARLRPLVAGGPARRARAAVVHPRRPGRGRRRHRHRRVPDHLDAGRPDPRRHLPLRPRGRRRRRVGARARWPCSTGSRPTGSTGASPATGRSWSPP